MLELKQINGYRELKLHLILHHQLPNFLHEIQLKLVIIKEIQQKRSQLPDCFDYSLP